MNGPPNSAAAGSAACTRCGCRSPWVEAFETVKVLGSRRLCCPPCARRLRARGRRAGLLLFVLAMALLAIRRERLDGVEVCALFLMLAGAFQYPLLLLHELGHAVAARLVGAPAYAIALGREPWRFDRSVFGLRWRFGHSVTGGITYHAVCEGAGAKWRALVISAAGPFVNLLIAAAAFAACFAQPGGAPGNLEGIAWLALGASSALQCFANLWPRQVATAVGKVASDGARILQLLRGPADDVRKARGAQAYFQAQFAFADRDFPRALELTRQARSLLTEAPMPQVLSVLQSAALIERDEPGRAAALLRPLAAEPVEPQGLRAIIANNLAVACLLIDDPASRAEGLRLATEAHGIAPWEPSVRGTLACLLAASAAPGDGRSAAARALLAGRTRLTRQQRAWTAVTQGLCAIADGDLATARGRYEQAQYLGATAAPLRLLERRIPNR